MRIGALSLLIGVVCVVAPGCARRHDPASPKSAPAVPLSLVFEGLGDYHRPISTRSSEAQAFFDQGLVLLHAANVDEAVRSFREAARLDPDAAMPWWGIAVARGPHVDAREVDADEAAEERAAIVEAQTRAAAGSPVEQALVRALATHTLHEVYEQFPDDPDVAALYAEDRLLQGDLEEARAIVDALIARAPRHPGANHLHAHLVVASRGVEDPARVLATADRLRTLAPAAGHLVHLGARLYARLGQWSTACDAGEAALAADRRYRARVPARSHRWALLAAHDEQAILASALMEGRERLASQTASELLALLPPSLVVATPAIGDLFEPAPEIVLVRFGRWDAILDGRPRELAADLPLTKAIRRLARGLASVRKDDLAFAKIERDALAREAQDVPATAMVGASTPARLYVTIAARILTGEIAARADDWDTAIEELRAAVSAEDSLAPDAPRWPLPARHFLGAVLLDAGLAVDAEAVYREDLEQNPENGWSLVGLANALRAQGLDASELDARVEVAFRRADAKITSSRF